MALASCSSRSVLEQISPTGAVVVSTRDERDACLFPEEELIVRNALESRRREFMTARACAREALIQLGLPPQAIPIGAHGDPQWPDQVVGSITHCDGYRAAALAHVRDFTTIGIDAEPNRPLPDGVLEAIASSDEHEWVQRRMKETTDLCWDRLLFSIKESLYKAWFPLTKRILGFEDATVLIDPIRQTFSSRLTIGGMVADEEGRSCLSGRWVIREGLVVAATALPRT